MCCCCCRRRRTPPRRARGRRRGSRLSTSHFHRILRFKTYLPVWFVVARASSPASGAWRILSDDRTAKLVRTVMDSVQSRKTARRRARSSSGSGSSTTPSTPSRWVAWRMRPSPSQNAMWSAGSVAVGDEVAGLAARRPGCRRLLLVGVARDEPAGRPEAHVDEAEQSMPARSCRPRDTARRAASRAASSGSAARGASQAGSGSPPSASAGSQPGSRRRCGRAPSRRASPRPASGSPGSTCVTCSAAVVRGSARSGGQLANERMFA